jgi:ATP/ADP translocase
LKKIFDIRYFNASKRLLALFSIKRSEQRAVNLILFIICGFSISAAIGRSIGMTLLVAHSGTEVLPQVFIMIDLCVMVGSILYIKQSRIKTASRILTQLFVVFVLLNGAFAVLFLTKIAWVFSAFFVLFSALQILILIHIGTFVAHYFNSVQLKRLLPVILAGQPVGAAIGGGLVILFSHIFSIEDIIWLLSMPIIISWFLLAKLNQQFSPIINLQPDRKKTRIKQEIESHLKLYKRSKIVIWMAVSLVLFVFVNRMLEFEYQGLIYPAVYPELKERAIFFGQYEIVASIIGLFVQLFFTRWLLTRHGVGTSNIVYPALTLVIATGLIFQFGFLLGVIAQFINQELRNAIRSPANNIVFNAVPEQLWSSAKAFLNGLVFPVSTILASVSIIYLQQEFSNHGLQLRLNGMIVVFSIAGIIAAIYLAKSYKTGIFNQLNPDQDIITTQKIAPEKRIHELINHPSAQQQIVALKMIDALKTENFMYPVGKRLVYSHDDSVKYQCIKTLAHFPLHPVSLTYFIKALRSEKNPHILSQIITSMKAFTDTDTTNIVKTFILHPHPTVFSSALLCLHQSPYTKQHEALKRSFLLRFEQASHQQQSILIPYFDQLISEEDLPWMMRLVHSEHAHLQAQAIKLMTSHFPAMLPDIYLTLIEVLQRGDAKQQVIVLQALQEISDIQHWQAIIELLSMQPINVINAASELFRTRFDQARPYLHKQLFHTNNARQSFFILSMIKSSLSPKDSKELNQQCNDLLPEYIKTSALKLKLNTLPAASENQKELAEQLNNEAENQLGRTLAMIIHESTIDFDLYRSILSGLRSDHQLSVGHALEALSQITQSKLGKKLFDLFEYNLSTESGCTEAYKVLTGQDLIPELANTERLKAGLSDKNSR